MTREDIERMTTAPDCFVPTPEVVRELARRALAPDRARRVGEAVLEAVRKHDEEHAGAFGIDAIADDIGHDTNYMPHVEGARILRAVAAAMREEGA